MNAYTNKRSIVSPSYLEDLREIFYPLQYYVPKDYKNNSRYTNLRRLYDEEKGVYYHESWNQKFIDESAEDNFFTVTESEENRLDLVSYSYYGTPNYWWVIAIVNFMKLTQF